MKQLNQHELKQVSGGVQPSDVAEWVDLSSAVVDLLGVFSDFIDAWNASGSSRW